MNPGDAALLNTTHLKMIIKIHKKDLYFLLGIIALLVFSGITIAINTNNPPVFGHSADEIRIINQSGYNKTFQDAINSGELVGPQGIQGFNGTDGTNGSKGATGSAGHAWTCRNGYRLNVAGSTCPDNWVDCSGGEIFVTWYWSSDTCYWTCCTY